MHCNEEYAKVTPFMTRIAHGALAMSLMAPILGQNCLGWYHCRETSSRLAPVFFGDTIRCVGEATGKVKIKLGLYEIYLD